MTSTLLNIPWKVETPWGNTVDSKKENKQYSAQLGGKERWLKEESVNGGQCGSKKDNQWTNTFRSHRGQYCSKTFHDLVNSSSNWKQHCTWGTTSYLHLGGYPLKHGNDKCYRIVIVEWMLERCTLPRLTVGPSVLELKGALHRMNTGDKINIIDDANAFLFTIWFDKMRQIHVEEHWAYNDEPCTARYCKL